MSLENRLKVLNFGLKYHKMEKLRIYYGVQGDGMTFLVNSNDTQTIKKMFPDAQPPKSIFVLYD